MPTIGIKKRVLDKYLGREYTEKELDEVFFNYGLELDDIVVEKNAEGKEESTFKIEVPANRYDLLCVEGLARALRVFEGVEKPPRYEVLKVKDPVVLKVEKSVEAVRPYIVSAILRDVTFDEDTYNSFIDLQDKLHQNICRKRTLVSVGTHDLDTVKEPFYYRALKPEDIKFVPLNKTKEYNAKDLLEEYEKNELHLREFVPIIKDKPLYPVVFDSNNVVCSLPPIINSDHSKITLKTKNVFIEATAVDLNKANIVLDTIVALFSQYCTKKFTVEPVKVVYENGKMTEAVYPSLSYREQNVDVQRMNTKIGINVEADKAVELLTKMSLSAKKDKKGTVTVTIPPTRHDVLHECDVAEDLALAFGYNNLPTRLPQAHTVAQPYPLNKLSDQLRNELALAGWTEVMNFALCSEDDITTKLNRKDVNSVKIANPKTLEFQVARNSLLPGLLKTLSNNKEMPLPIKLFEVQDIILKDTTKDTNSRNQRNAAAVYYSKTGSFEVIHGLLDRIFEVLDVPLSKSGGRGYFIKEKEDDATYFPGRSAEINYRDEKGTVTQLGVFGILHPQVLANFNLNMPCCALEINIEPFI
ncbi:unnamed protein product [Bursaphelenchus okinawaensis]|uniref:Phenylalanine--tRNA ligase beta subunit n=1 Tax=Bursaphelenchus okinawaensis TaxID=465554 RepID=A0A811LM58_9BILA|nr:unnamed protein product [Bursaphelenchus okinawaensis]CAG9126461.1 unnamed protein product [Bursaphelenchus okinawaensis]